MKYRDEHQAHEARHPPKRLYQLSCLYICSILIMRKLKKKSSFYAPVFSIFSPYYLPISADLFSFDITTDENFTTLLKMRGPWKTLLSLNTYHNEKTRFFSLESGTFRIHYAGWSCPAQVPEENFLLVPDDMLFTVTDAK